LKYFSILLCALVLFPFTTTYGQESQANSASIYSYLGLGTPQDFLSPYTSGMSLVGVAVPDRSKASLANPAFWGGTYFTSISAGMNMNNYDASDNFNSSASTTLGFSHFQAQFPILRERIGFSVGLYRDTEIRYNVLTRDTINLPSADTLAAVDYRSSITGNGGINRIEAGFGFRVNDYLYLGYAPSLMFGVEERDNQIVFDNSLFGPARFTERTRYRAFAHRFGVMALTPRLFGSNDRVILGATATLPVELSANRRIVSQQLSNQGIAEFELIPEEAYGQREVTFPFETTIGISYLPTPGLLLSTEAHYQQWSEHDGFDGESGAFMKDRLRVALGVEYDAFSRGNDGLWNNLIYRFGTSYDDGHLSINDTNIETLMFSAGIGIPSRTGISSIDISIDYGIRGTMDDDLVRERIFGLRLSLNLSEMMFIQRRVN